MTRGVFYYIGYGGKIYTIQIDYVDNVIVLWSDKSHITYNWKFDDIQFCIEGILFSFSNGEVIEKVLDTIQDILQKGTVIGCEEYD